MIKVTIIVPVYNVEAYLDKCLNTLVNQTLKEIQVIVVNDGSKDDSYKIIENYAEEFNDKIVYIKKENGGLSDARNAGLPYATGDYIGFVDGDDYVDITMFEKMYTAAKRGNADIVECDYYKVYNKKLKPKIGKIYEIKDMMVKARVCAWNRIVKREIIMNNGILFPKGLQYEDNEYLYKLIPHISKIEFIKEPLYYYVQRDNSICQTFDGRVTDIYQVMDNVFEYYKKNDLYNKYKDQLEYITAKKYLSSSFFRIVRINNKEIRKKILSENWERLLNIFPLWNKNLILKNSSSLLDIFVKSQNRFTYIVYTKL